MDGDNGEGIENDFLMIWDWGIVPRPARVGESTYNIRTE